MRNNLLIVFIELVLSCSSRQQSSPVEKKESALNLTSPATLKGPAIDSSLVIFDTSSNLCWMKQDFSFMNHRFLNEWKEVFAWRDQMNASGYAGFNDWAVPSISQYR